MEKIKKRINVDYHLRWPVTVRGATTSLADLNLTLEVTNMTAGKFVLPIEVVDGAVEFDFPASLQTSCGSYTFTLWANYGSSGQAAVDVVDNLQLVRWTKDESVPTESNLNIDQMLTLEGNLVIIGIKGKDATINGFNAVEIKGGANTKVDVDEDGTITITAKKGDKGEDGKDGSILYPTFHVDKATMHLKMDTISDETTNRIGLNNGHLLLKL